jgi:hypothetical protein
VKGDGRSLRVALVSDAVMNPADGGGDAFTLLAASGWGVIGLPPAALPDADAAAWTASAADQARELARHGVRVVAVLDDDDARAEEQLIRALAAPPELAVPILRLVPRATDRLTSFLA